MTSFTWTNNNHDGIWAESGNWSPSGVPGASDTASIAISSLVFVDSVVTVQTLLNSSGDIETGFGSGDELIVGNNGGQNSQNGNDISLEADSALEIGTGTFKNTGEIDLIGSGSSGNASVLIGNGTVSLTGMGKVQLLDAVGDDLISGIGQFSGLDNVNNTIIGSGTIGSSLDFTNGANGTIETNMEGSPGGTINFVVGQSGFTFTNNGDIIAANQGSVIFGQDNSVEGFTNNGLIALEGDGSSTSLVIAGQVTFSGTGEIDLVDSPFFSNYIMSDGKAAELTTSIPIEGSGTIGDSHLTLNNFSTIGSSNGVLILNTGANTIVNSDNGTIGASFTGVVQIDSPVQNSQGNIAAAEFGNTQILAPVSGGTVNIEFDGIITLAHGGSVSGNIEFTGSGGTLLVQGGASQIGGAIVGAEPTDDIDAQFLPYSSGIQAQWQQNGATGTLSLVNGTTTLTSFTLSGQYTAANFKAVNDGEGHAQIDVVNPPPPAGTTADMIMRDGSNGDYEIYDLGSNAILAAYGLVQASTAYQVAGLGNFDNVSDSDMILRSSVGAFQVYDVSNNNVTDSTSLGQVGQEWTVSGFGDFSGIAGETDMLMRNGNNGKFEVYDINANAITNAASMGQVGAPWVVAGFGDFSGHAGETGDMLMRNGTTGQFEVYDITNNQITFAAGMGQVGLEWQVAGFGDFSGNANETDMLMRNNNTGAFQVFDISNNAIYNAASMGQVGSEWHVAGFGPIDGAGSSDMLMRNTNTGAFEVFDIANNTITNSASMGQVGNEWSVGGIAVDPPAGQSGADTAPSQLVQAMASYAASGSVLGTDPSPQQPSPSELPTSTVLTAPQA